jgi:hypothetical protein
MLHALARPLGTVFLLALSVIGLPWAVDRSVRWAFVPHAVILDDIAPADAAAASAAAVQGQWWRTAGTELALALIGAAPGPLLGIALLVTMDAGVDFVNAISSVFYAAVLPFSILGSAILYRRRQGGPLPAAASSPRTEPATDTSMSQGTA